MRSSFYIVDHDFHTPVIIYAREEANENSHFIIKL